MVVSPTLLLLALVQSRKCCKPTVLIIATCVRWYLRFSLSLRNVEEMMAERRLMVDHTTVWRWCQKYGPAIYHRVRGKLKYTTTTQPSAESSCLKSNRMIRTEGPRNLAPIFPHFPARLICVLLLTTPKAQMDHS